MEVENLQVSVTRNLIQFESALYKGIRVSSMKSFTKEDNFVIFVNFM